MSNVYAVNKTESSIIVSSWNVYYINSTNAELITVYDSQNTAYNAFKYITDNIDYYYVLDGVHSEWTDDLASIGYSLTPVVVLPTVSVTGDWGSGNWLYVGVSAEYVYANASRLLYISPGGQQLLYDASKSYSPMRYTSSNGGSYKSPVEKFTISGNSEATAKVVVNNITSSNLVLYSISVAVCSSNQATVVTVYDSQNTAYNAFKYNDGTTDYYYVLDSVQVDWTNDLASIGYSLTPSVVLPEVSVTGDWGSGNWLATSINGVESISADSNTTNLGYNASTIFPNYDDTKTYGIVQWQVTGGETAGRVEFSIVNASGKFQAHNNTNGMLSFYQARVAACSDSTATVVTVYDSSNNAYNAFKYTLNGTDYYYVLDGTQTDWTDDLAGIGYSLTPAVITAYFTNRGSSATSDTTITPSDTQGSSYYALYDASGVNIDNDSSKTYTFYKAYRYDGTEEGFSAPPEIGGRYWYLTFHVPGNGWNSYAYRVEYTVS